MVSGSPTTFFFQPDEDQPLGSVAPSNTKTKQDYLPPEQAWQAARQAWLIERNLPKALQVMSTCWSQVKPNRYQLTKQTHLAQLGELYGQGLLQAQRYVEAEAVFRQKQDFIGAGYAAL